MAQWTYFHTLDPFIIRFAGNIGLRWYSLAYIMGFFLAYLLAKRLMRKNITPLRTKDLMDLVIWTAFGVIAGGRLGYAVFYAPELLIGFDSAFPYWDLLKIHQGGLASHGGIIGLIAGAGLLARKRGFAVLHCMDLIALGSLGIFLGRITNFINGELFGRVITGKALWAVQFPQEMLLWVSQKKVEHLQDLSTAVSKLNLNVSADMWRDWVYQFSAVGGQRAQIYSVINSLINACERGNREVVTALREVLSLRYPSQIYQGLLEGLLPFLITWFLFNKKKPLRPGMIGGTCALCYGLMRIVGERFRLPDAHLGFQAWGLTRGQWLSIFMLVCVAVYFFLVFKFSKAEKK